VRAAQLLARAPPRRPARANEPVRRRSPPAGVSPGRNREAVLAVVRARPGVTTRELAGPSASALWGESRRTPTPLAYAGSRVASSRIAPASSGSS
jgi:hypothetical protein